MLDSQASREEPAVTRQSPNLRFREAVLLAEHAECDLGMSGDNRRKRDRGIERIESGAACLRVRFDSRRLGFRFKAIRLPSRSAPAEDDPAEREYLNRYDDDPDPSFHSQHLADRR